MHSNGFGSTNPDVPPPGSSAPKDSTADRPNSPGDEPAIKKGRLHKPGSECDEDTKTDIVMDEPESSSSREVRNQNMTTPLLIEIPPDPPVNATFVQHKNEDAKRKKAKPNGGMQNVAQPPAERLPNDQLETRKNQSKLIDKFLHVAPSSSRDDLQVNSDSAIGNVRQPVNLHNEFMDDIPCSSQQADERDTMRATLKASTPSLIQGNSHSDSELIYYAENFVRVMKGSRSHRKAKLSNEKKKRKSEDNHLDKKAIWTGGFLQEAISPPLKDYAGNFRESNQSTDEDLEDVDYNHNVDHGNDESLVELLHDNENSMEDDDLTNEFNDKLQPRFNDNDKKK